MKEKELIENNKLIAEFMDFDVFDVSIDPPDDCYCDEDQGCGYSYNDEYGDCDNCMRARQDALDNMEYLYHDSWDWLMPVVDRALSIGNEWGIDYIITDLLMNVDFDGVYKYVVKKIKWFNKNKK